MRRISAGHWSILGPLGPFQMYILVWFLNASQAMVMSRMGKWILRSLFLKGFGGCPFWDFSNLTHRLSHMIPLKDENIAAQPNLGQHQVLSLLLPFCAELFLNINSSLCLTSQMFTCCLSYSFYLFIGNFFFLVCTVIPYMVPVLHPGPAGM